MLNAMVKPPRIEEPDDQPEDPFANIEGFKDRTRRASDFLKALAHENRLLILCLIAEKERSVTELETLLSLRQPAVSQQLARLRMDGLVATRREGKAIYYRLANDRVRRIMGVMYDVFCRGDIDGEPAGPVGNHRARS
jgi:DNA-binding transcriptional ArsR family regulator